jgi:ATP-binding cassette subfamily B protein RaxB
VVDAVNRDLASQKLTLGSARANGLVFGIERVAIVWLGALLVLDSAFSVGMLFAFVAYKEQFSARVAGLIDKLIELRMLNLQGERLADIVLTPPEQESPPRPWTRSTPPSRCARFRSATPIPSPSCCSTARSPWRRRVGRDRGRLRRREDDTAQADAGPAAPTDGKILAGGVDIQKLGIDRYRKLVGTVMQDDQLFAGSIADNVSFFDPSPDQAPIEHCARMAAVHDDIAAMPMATTRSSATWARRSPAASSQRILLARALYKRRASCSSTRRPAPSTCRRSARSTRRSGRST